MIIIKTQEQLRQEIIGFCDISSQAAVARSIGVTRAYIHDIVKGNSTISKKVAKFFGYAVEISPPTRIYKRIDDNDEIN